MSAKIDFTQWTDAQLDSLPSAFATPDTDAEIARRKAKGTWMMDGSRERVARLIRDNSPGSAARKDARRRSRNNPD